MFVKRQKLSDSHSTDIFDLPKDVMKIALHDTLLSDKDRLHFCIACKNTYAMLSKLSMEETYESNNITNTLLHIKKYSLRQPNSRTIIPSHATSLRIHRITRTGANRSAYNAREDIRWMNYIHDPATTLEIPTIQTDFFKFSHPFSSLTTLYLNLSYTCCSHIAWFAKHFPLLPSTDNKEDTRFVIPNSVTSLHLVTAYCFPDILDFIILPLTLKEFAFDGMYTKNISFPSTLKTLELRNLQISKESELIKNFIIPRSVKELHLCVYNADIIFDLPKGLEHLKVDVLYFDTLLSQLPNSLRILEFGSYHTLRIKNLLPPNLEYIDFGCSYVYPISDILPPSIKRINIPETYTHPIRFNKELAIYKNRVLQPSSSSS